MPILSHILGLMLAMCLSVQAAGAGDVALVIGNRGQVDYLKDGSGIRTRDFSSPLRAAGFRVVQPKNRSSGHMRLAVQSLEAALGNGQVDRLVIVLMGPVARTKTENWIVSNGATAAASRNIGITALPLGAISAMAARARGRAVILIAPGRKMDTLGGGLMPGLGDFTPADGVTYVTGPAADLATVLQQSLLNPALSFDDARRAAPDSVAFSGFISGQVGLMGPPQE